MPNPEAGKRYVEYGFGLEEKRVQLRSKIEAVNMRIRHSFAEFDSKTTSGNSESENTLKKLSPENREKISKYRSLNAAALGKKTSAEIQFSYTSKKDGKLEVVHKFIKNTPRALRELLLNDPPINQQGQKELLNAVENELKASEVFAEVIETVLQYVDEVRTGAKTGSEPLRVIIEEKDSASEKTSTSTGTSGPTDGDSAAGAQYRTSGSQSSSRSTGTQNRANQSNSQSSRDQNTTNANSGTNRGSQHQGNQREQSQAEQQQSNEQAEPQEAATEHEQTQSRQQESADTTFSWVQGVPFILGLNEMGAGADVELELDRLINEAMLRQEIPQPTSEEVEEILETVAQYLIASGRIAEKDRTGRVLSYQEVLNEALKRRMALRDIFSASLTIYLATKNVSDLRASLSQEMQARIVRGVENDKNTNEASTKVKNGLLFILSGLGTTTLATFGQQLLGVLDPQFANSPAHSAVSSALISGIGSALMRGVSQFRDRTSGITELSQITSWLESKKNKEGELLIGTTTAEAIYSDLLDQTVSLLKNNRLSREDEAKAYALIERLTLAKTRLEIDMTIKTTVDTAESPEIQLAKMLLRFHQISTAETDRYAQLKHVKGLRFQELTGRKIAEKTFQSLGWATVGGAFGLLRTANLPFFAQIFKPTPVPGFMFSTIAGSMLRDSKNNWAVSLIAERLGRVNPEPQKRSEKEKVPGWSYWVLPPIDEDAFYVGAKIAPGQDKELRERIQRVNNFTIDKKRELLRERKVFETELLKTPKGPQGYFYLTKGREDKVQASRIWPLPIERGTTWVNSDPSNWPDMQEEDAPQNPNNLRRGQIRTWDFDITTLYDTDPITNGYKQKRAMSDLKENGLGQEFRNSWNLPEDIWVPLEDGPTEKGYQSVLTVKSQGKTTQILIRPDLIGRVAYEVVEKKLDLQKLYDQLLEAHINHEEDIEKILIDARNRP